MPPAAPAAAAARASRRWLRRPVSTRRSGGCSATCSRSSPSTPRTPPSRSTASRVQDAFVFACEHHAAQRRKSGEDFIVHPVGVARICASMRLDTETLCAALLHDTIEDTSASIEEVRERFGEEIAAIVDGVTKLTDITFQSRDDAQASNYRKMIVAMADDPRVILIKLARPPAQHAHDRRDAEAEADGEGARDARHLRAARASPGDPRDQVGARGPRVRDAAPAQVPGDQGAGGATARGARALRERGRQLPRQRARRAGHRSADRGACQALLLDLLEDDEEGPRVQRDLRPHRDACDRRLGEGLLRHGRRDPLAVEAAARALQGLHRDAQVQHVPVAAHDGHRARGPAAGDPDPDPRDARNGGVRGGGALGLQAARAPRHRAVARAPARTRSSSGCARCSTGRTSSPIRASSWRRCAPTSSRRRSTCSRPRAKSSRSPPARRRSTSPTRCTRRSATAAWARA